MIFQVAIISSAITALIFLFIVRKNQNAINSFGCFLIVSAIFEIIFFQTSSSNNLYLVPIYTVLEFLFLSLFFFFIYNKPKSWLALILLGITLIIINALFIQSNDKFNSNSKVLVYFVFITLSLWTLLRLIRKDKEEKMDDVIKYFLFGLLLNFSGSFILYLFSNIIMTFEVETQKNLWYISISLNIIAQFLFLVGLLKYRKISQTALYE